MNPCIFLFVSDTTTLVLGAILWDGAMKNLAHQWLHISICVTLSNKVKTSLKSDTTKILAKDLEGQRERMSGECKISHMYTLCSGGSGSQVYDLQKMSAQMFSLLSRH